MFRFFNGKNIDITLKKTLHIINELSIDMATRRCWLSQTAVTVMRFVRCFITKYINHGGEESYKIVIQMCVCEVGGGAHSYCFLLI